MLTVANIQPLFTLTDFCILGLFGVVVYIAIRLAQPRADK
jgi:hypothetical protein